MKKTTLIVALSLISALAVMVTGRAVITKAWSSHPPQSQSPSHHDMDEDWDDDDDEDCDEAEDMDDDEGDVADAADVDMDGDDDWDDDSDRYKETEEINQTYQLAPGALLNVHRINGKVTIETTAAGSTAEVHIVRKARNREAFNRRKFTIEATANLLDLHEEKQKRDDDDEDNNRYNVRYTVVVKAPANINLTASGINGAVRVGRISGKAEVSGVNGGVKVASAGTCSSISGINGSVEVGLQRIGEDGLRISGVNGRVECRFEGSVDAEISTGGVNGSVDVDLPNVTLIGKQTRTSFNGRIGAGGPQIKISGVNGSVSLRPGQLPL